MPRHTKYTLNELHVLARHVALLFNQEVKKRLEPPPTSQKKKKKLRHLNLLSPSVKCTETE